MRTDRTSVAFAALVLLAACQPQEEENIQTKTENRINMLENRAEEVAAEAENVTDDAANALDNEASIFANQADATGEGNAAADNRQ
jgi:hypothetical protein